MLIESLHDFLLNNNSKVCHIYHQFWDSGSKKVHDIDL